MGGDKARPDFAPDSLIIRLNENADLSDIEGMNQRLEVEECRLLFPQMDSPQERLEALKEKRASLGSGSHTQWYWYMDKDSAEYKEYMARLEAEGRTLDEQIEALEGLVARLEQRQMRAPAGVVPPKMDKTYLLKFGKPVEVKKLIPQYSIHPAIKYAEPDYIMKLEAFPDTLPNDTYVDPDQDGTWSTEAWGQDYEDLWGARKIQAHEAWKVTLGETVAGESVIVAVIDSGIDYDHEDLLDSVWENTAEIAGNGIDDDGNGYIDDVRGWDFVRGDNNPKDDNGHGSHCSGTIAAAGDNGKGIIGIAPKVKIMPLKSFDERGSGSVSNSVTALYYAVNMGADVTSNSYGSYNQSQARTDAFTFAHSQGVINLAAAGNSDEDVEYHAPSNIPCVIAVAATDSNDRKVDFSNYGSMIDVSAPGLKILSTYPTHLSHRIRPFITVTTNNDSLVECDYFGYSASIPDPDLTATILHVGNEGYGYPADFEGQVFTDRVALIRRGEIAFGDKVDNAIAAGATAVIIYNNIDTWISGSLGSSKSIPALFVSKDDGELLAGLISSGETILTLAHVDLHPYAVYNGTSMACPHAAGVAALLVAKYPADPAWKNMLRLIYGSDDIDGVNPGFEGLLGKGRLNAYRSLTMLDTELPGPVLQVAYHYYDNHPEPDREVKLSFIIIDNGATARNVAVDLTSSSPDVAIINGNDPLGDVEFKAPKVAELSFKLNDGAPLGIALDFVASISTDNAATTDFSFQIEVPEASLRCVRNIPDELQWRPPVVVDMNLDGQKEIVFITHTWGIVSGDLIVRGKVYALRPDGTDVPGWPVTTDITFAYDAATAVAVGDINKDGLPEVVVYGLTDGPNFEMLNVMEVYDLLGRPLAGFPKPFILGDYPKWFSGLALADIDGNDSLDIITRYMQLGFDPGSTFEMGTYVDVLDHQGKSLTGWPYYWFLSDDGSSLAVGDVDGNGTQEIFFGYAPNFPLEESLLGLKPDGTLLDGWPILSSVNNFGDALITLANIDGTGYAEIMSASAVEPNALLTYDFSGASVNSSIIPDSGASDEFEVIVANLDDNADLEQIVSDPKGAIHVFGASTGSWPASPVASGVPNIYYPTTVVAGDIDGDGRAEILNWTVSQESWGSLITDSSFHWLNAWNHDGTPVDGFPLKYPGHYRGHFGNNLALGDLDADGDVEIVSAGTAWAYSDSLVLIPRTVVGVVDLDDLYDESNMDWPMFRHDPQRTGMHSVAGGPEPNDPPIINPIGNQSGRSDEVFMIRPIEVMEPDNDNIAEFTAIGFPVPFDEIWTELDSRAGYYKGFIRWPNPKAGTYAVAFIARDGDGAIDTETITITIDDVNRPSVISPIGNQSGRSDEVFIVRPIEVSDPDNDRITGFTTTGFPVPFADIWNEITDQPGYCKGFIRWASPKAGTYTVTFTATDEHGATDTETVTVTIADINRSPVLGSVGNQTGSSDQIFTIRPIIADDIDGDSMVMGATGFPVPFEDIWGDLGSTPGSLKGMVRWFNPPPGTYNVRFTVSDGRGGVAGEDIRIDIAAAGNQPPVLWEVGPQWAHEGGIVKIRVKASDIDGDNLVMTATGLPAGFELLEHNIHNDVPGLPPGYVEYRIYCPYTETVAGTYNVNLKVTDTGGLFDDETVAITIEAPGNFPIFRSSDYDVTYDFLSDTVLDDYELLFQRHPNAASYRVVPYYGTILGFGTPIDIPNQDIETLRDGTLQYIWVDFQDGQPHPVIGAAMTFVNGSGVESDRSLIRYPESPKTIIYGRVTDSAGTPIEGVKVHTDQIKDSNNEEIDYGNFYTNAAGYYFIKGLLYDMGDGDKGKTHLKLYKTGYQNSLNNEVIIDRDGQVERKDVTLVP